MKLNPHRWTYFGHSGRCCTKRSRRESSGCTILGGMNQGSYFGLRTLLPTTAEWSRDSGLMFCTVSKIPHQNQWHPNQGDPCAWLIVKGRKGEIVNIPKMPKSISLQVEAKFEFSQAKFWNLCINSKHINSKHTCLQRKREIEAALIFTQIDSLV